MSATIEDMGTLTLLREFWTASVDAVGYINAPLAFVIALCLLAEEPQLFDSFNPTGERQATLDEFAAEATDAAD